MLRNAAASASSRALPLNVTHATARDQPFADLLDHYRKVRSATTALISGLSPEDCALQSMPDASPLKWHLAHVTWFFETFVLEQAQPGYRHFRPEFRVLFNSYYVTVGERHPRPERGLLSRPPLNEVLDYREHVDAAMARVIAQGEVLPQPLRELIVLGLHHEQQHQELMLTDFKHLLSRSLLRPAYRAAATLAAPIGKQAEPLRWAEYAEGLHAIGHEGERFAFDNETPRHRVFVEAYALGSRLVTNGEYQAFIDDGGYTRPELWLSEGWDTLQAQRWHAPLYWEKRDGAWQSFTLFGMQQSDAAAPVCHVSYYEADAYARWAGARLPSEAEWEAAAVRVNINGNFVEQGVLQPLPARAAARQSAEPAQLYGDVWEWTHSSYAPYPGYSPAPGAVGEYNGKFMVNQYVLRGGSFATPQSHIRASYRNFFPAAARWQFMGIRLARSA